MKSTLTDQIGAMAIVDKLRFDSHRVQDFMNTTEQKAVLIEKIAQGYRNEGATVSADVIEEGVNQWYQNRLTLNAEPLPWYLGMFIKRDVWLKPVIAAVLVLVTVMVLVSSITSHMKHKALDQDGQVAQEALNLLSFEGNKAIEESIYPFVKDINILLTNNEEKRQQIAASIRSEVARVNLEIKKSVEPDMKPLAAFTRQYTDVTATMDNLRRDLKSFARLRESFDHDKTDSNISTYPQLQTLVQKVENLLLKPGMTLPELKEGINNLQTKLDIVNRAVPLRQQVESLTERSLKQLSQEKDKDMVRSLSGRILIAIDALNPVNPQGIKELEQIEALSRTDLRLIVNPNKKGKSGIERTFNGSGGKAWYVVVQPLNEAQEPVKLNIKSAETGDQRMTDIFAVRVSKDRYDKLKSDKLDDGIINDDLVGVKPVGLLDFSFETGYEAEYILEW